MDFLYQYTDCFLSYQYIFQRLLQHSLLITGVSQRFSDLKFEYLTTSFFKESLDLGTVKSTQTYFHQMPTVIKRTHPLQKLTLSCNKGLIPIFLLHNFPEMEYLFHVCLPHILQYLAVLHRHHIAQSLNFS